MVATTYFVGVDYADVVRAGVHYIDFVLFAVSCYSGGIGADHQCAGRLEGAQIDDCDRVAFSIGHVGILAIRRSIVGQRPDFKYHQPKPLTSTTSNTVRRSFLTRVVRGRCQPLGASWPEYGFRFPESFAPPLPRFARPGSSIHRTDRGRWTARHRTAPCRAGGALQ